LTEAEAEAEEGTGRGFRLSGARKRWSEASGGGGGREEPRRRGRWRRGVKRSPVLVLKKKKRGGGGNNKTEKEVAAPRNVQRVPAPPPEGVGGGCPVRSPRRRGSFTGPLFSAARPTPTKPPRLWASNILVTTPVKTIKGHIRALIIEKGDQFPFVCATALCGSL